jgi:Zn-dependent protease
LNASTDQWGEAILKLIAFVLSVSVHEFGHAWAATRLGDPMPRLQGRLTLNPKHHIDPVGTLVLPLVMAFSTVGGPLLGWGRPVMTNTMAYTKRVSRVTGHMLVAIAGPAMNLVLAALVSLLIVAGARLGFMPEDLKTHLEGKLVVLNLSLMFFNLLPVPPLDGGAVLAWALPRSMQGIMDLLTKWGFLILLGLMLWPDSYRVIMAPASLLTQRWLTALAGAIGS